MPDPTHASSLEPRSTELELPSAGDLRLFYLLFLGVLGTQVSYLPLAFQERGLSLLEISALLSLPSLMRIVSPSLWAYLADRLQATGLLLRIMCWGALVSFLPVMSGSNLVIGASLLAYTFFRVPASVLADTLAFRRVAATGGSYGELRMWGTVGYVLATVLGGYVAERFGAARVVEGGAVLLLGAALLTHRLPRPARAPLRRLGPALRVLLTRRSFQLFLLATMLHTVGQAAYDSFFPIHLGTLGVSRHVIGWAVALGATAEVAVMWGSRALVARMGTVRLYAFSSLVAAGRWALTAWVVDPRLAIAIQVLHGVTYGAWYVSAATYVDEVAPPEVRASGQALLAVASFGLGGMVAMGLAGWVAGRYGTPAMFAACAACALVAAALMGLVGRETRAKG